MVQCGGQVQLNNGHVPAEYLHSNQLHSFWVGSCWCFFGEVLLTLYWLTQLTVQHLYTQMKFAWVLSDLALNTYFGPVLLLFYWMIKIFVNHFQVVMANDCIGEEVEAQAAALPNGGVLLLENVRFHKEEEKNDPEFAKKLAALADLYVNDAFGTAHRAHASTEGVTKYLRPSVSGFLMQKVHFFSASCWSMRGFFVTSFDHDYLSGLTNILIFHLSFKISPASKIINIVGILASVAF